MKYNSLKQMLSIKHHGMEPSMKENIVMDLDGVIVDFYRCKENCDYSKYPNITLKRNRCPLRKGTIKTMTAIKKMGFRIVIFTARIERERKVTERWLKKNKVPYDELVMNKPRGWLYPDDFGYRFDGWGSLLKFIIESKKK